MDAWSWSHWGDYVVPLGGALLLGLLVHFGLRLLARRAGQHDSSRARWVRVVTVPMAFALPLLFVSVAVRTVPMPESQLELWIHLLRLALLACVTWLLVRIVGAIESSILRRNPMEIADNLHARRIQTQARVLSRIAMGTIILLGVSLALMTFPAVRQIGTTLLASAGIMGLVAGIAARPVFGNLIAGLQIALAQPIRLDDVVIVEGEWGRIEEISSTYVVVRIWDERRMVVPLSWFIENPFQNWTRRSSQLIGTVFLWVDYALPLAPLREELERITHAAPEWDGRTCVLQVTDADSHAMQVRILVSTKDSGRGWDLRCKVREGLIDFLQRDYPQYLPKLRVDDEPDVPQERIVPP